jgi:thiamine biosynthesis lipoprotein
MKRLLPFLALPLLIVIVVFAVRAKHRPPAKAARQWFGMDTDFSATLFAPGSRGTPKAKPEEAFALLEKESARRENVFSDFLPGSSLKDLRGRAGDTVAAAPEILEVFRAAEEMAGASRGSFDITLHNLKSAWGLASGEANRIPSDAEIAAALHGNPAFGAPIDSNPAETPAFRVLDDGRIVLLRDSVVFDLGGIAKGYTVDRMHAVLDSLGYPDHILTAGGDLRVGGEKAAPGDGKPAEPWSLGIRHPRHTDALAGTLTLRQPRAVSTSGDYERYFLKDEVRYHHIFDPRTGKPARPYCSVTVLASSSLLADRLTKPLFILGPEAGADLLKRFGAKAVWMREIGSAQGSGRAAMDEEGAPKLCYVASEGLSDVLAMKGLLPCDGGR